jgi:hypothetical protein
MNTAGDDRPRLRLCVADGAGTTTSLEEWMSFVTDELARQRAVIKELSNQSAEISRALLALKSSLAESRQFARALGGDSADQRQRMADLDRRLNNILALIERNFSGGQTEQAMQHHDYATEYVVLVEQKIIGLALDILPGGADATPREKAEFVAAVCADLFGALEVTEQQLLGRLPEAAPARAIERMREICAEARALRAKVAHGRPQRWEFSCETDVPINEDWQELWTGAPLGGVIEFVVAPAYFVDSDTLLMKQKVFTIAAGSANGAADPAGP